MQQWFSHSYLMPAGITTTLILHQFYAKNMARFVVSDPRGTPEQRYKWLWEQQRSEYTVLQLQYERVVEALRDERVDNKAAHHQLDMMTRERDTYAGALAQAHRAIARYETLLASVKDK